MTSRTRHVAPPPGPQTRGVTVFAAPAPGADRGRVGELATAVASALLMAGIVIGLPVLLALSLGPPWPATVPDPGGLVDAAWSALRRPDDGSLLLAALGVIAWSAWALFTTALAVEALAQLRGLPAPRLPGLGVTQQLTTRLVAALALALPATSITLLAPGSAGAAATQSVTWPRLAEQAPSGHDTALFSGQPMAPRIGIDALRARTNQSTDAATLGDPARAPARRGPVGGGGSAAASTNGHGAPRPAAESGSLIYRVAPPHGGHHDTLWGIAQRHLGDPLRWREIATLNLGRPQPDGAAMRDPDWIRPGWLLVMPEDATGLSPATGYAATEAPVLRAPEPTVAQQPAPGAPDETEPTQPGPAQIASAPTAAAVEETQGTSGLPRETRTPQAGQSPAAEPSRGHAAPAAAPTPTAVATTTAQVGEDPTPSESAPRVGAPAADPRILLELLAGAGLLTAGLLAALTRARALARRHRSSRGAAEMRGSGPSAELAATEIALRVLAEPDDLDLLDAALRLLGEQRTATPADHPQGEPNTPASAARDLDGAAPSGGLSPPMDGSVPRLIGARLDADAVHLHLRQAAPGTPGPFTVAPDGLVWTLTRAALHQHTALTGPTNRLLGFSGAPALLPVGREDESVVLLDLDTAGLTALTGEPEHALGLLRRYAAELAVAPWAEWAQITLVGFGGGLTGLDPDRIRHLDHLDAPNLAGLDANSAEPDDPSSRHPLDGAPRDCEILLIAEELPGLVAARLADLCRRPGVAALIAGDYHCARTRLEVRQGGHVVVPAMHATVSAGPLPAATTRAVLDLLDQARNEPDAQPTTLMDLPLPAADDTSGPTVPRSPFTWAGTAACATAVRDSRLDVSLGDPDQLTLDSLPDADADADADDELDEESRPSAPRREARQRATADPLDGDLVAYLDPSAQHLVLIGILGPVEVRADNPTPTRRGPLLTEIAVYLALHPAGVDPEKLDFAIWPEKDIKPATRHEALARLRSWLGTTTDGLPHLPRHPGSAPVALAQTPLSDWDLFTRLTHRGQLPGADTVGDLSRALALVHGRPFQGVPAHHYAWLAETYLEQDITEAVLTAAHTLAGLRLADGDPAGARAAARTAQMVDRYDERSWRDLIQAEADLGNLAAVRALADELTDLLDAELYDDLTPQTAQLVRSILGTSQSPPPLPAVTS